MFLKTINKYGENFYKKKVQLFSFVLIVDFGEWNLFEFWSQWLMNFVRKIDRIIFVFEHA